MELFNSEFDQELFEICDEVEKREMFDSSYDDQLYNHCEIFENQLNLNNTLQSSKTLQSGAGPSTATDPPSIAVRLPHKINEDSNKFDPSSQMLIDCKSEKPEPTTRVKTPFLYENPEPEIEMINNGNANAVLQTAKLEISCRNDLHKAQMANENQKLKNLLLKEKVLKEKLLYYRNKSSRYD